VPRRRSWLDVELDTVEVADDQATGAARVAPRWLGVALPGLAAVALLLAAVVVGSGDAPVAAPVPTTALDVDPVADDGAGALLPEARLVVWSGDALLIRRPADGRTTLLEELRPVGQPQLWVRDRWVLAHGDWRGGGLWRIDATGDREPELLAQAEHFMPAPGGAWAIDGTAVRLVGLDGAVTVGPLMAPGEVVAAAADGLVLDLGGAVAWWRPGDDAAVPIGAGRVLDAGPGPTVLWLAADGSVNLSDVHAVRTRRFDLPNTTSGCLSPTGGHALLSRPEGLQIVATDSGEPTLTTADAAAVAWAPDGSLVAAGRDGLLRLVDAMKGSTRALRPLRTMPLALAMVSDEWWLRPVVAEDLAIGWQVQAFATPPDAPRTPSVYFRTADTFEAVDVWVDQPMAARALRDGTVVGVVHDPTIVRVSVVRNDVAVEVRVRSADSAVRHRVFAVPPFGDGNITVVGLSAAGESVSRVRVPG
jgi:hypothetical protein